MNSILFHITLKDIRPSQNRHRVYTIAVYGGGEPESFSMTLFWGRVGSKKQRIVQACETKEALDKFLISVLKTRLKHGYLLVEQSEATPDYTILDEFERDSLYPSNQLNLFS